MTGVDKGSVEVFLAPVLALVCWTFAMWTLMYVRRIPAMSRITRDLQQFIRQPQLMEQLPDRAKWAADNYNHLHEQPVLFYATMGYLAVTAQTSPLNCTLAWIYVAVRIVHSLVQVTTNRVKVRFGAFALGSLILLALVIRALGALL